MSKVGILVINLITYGFMIWANYYTNSGAYNGENIGQISSELQNLISPAPPAFSIWSLIFVGILIFIISSFYGERKGLAEQSKAWPWLALSNILNGTWGFLFIGGNYPLSVLVMLALLFCVTKIAVNLRMELDDEPLRVIFTIWWPIVIYLGWLIAATLANIATTLVSLGVEPYTDTAQFIAIGVLLVAMVIYLMLIKYRNMREAAGVGVWALAWIATEQWDQNLVISYTAIAIAAVISIAAAMHAFKNKDTSPMAKIMNKS
jgi:hypothetical protein